MPVDMDRAVAVLIACTLMLLISVWVEKAQKWLLRWVNPNTVPIVHALFRELSLLGVVGLLFFMSNKSGALQAVSKVRFGEGNQHVVSELLQSVDMALFLSIVIFLLFVLYLLKTGHAMERRWNDRETAARFPKALFNEYEALNLKIRAQHGPLSRRGCRRKVLHCCRKAVCYKSAAVRRLEHVEENLVYAAIRARFLVPEATAAGTKPGANRMTGRRGSTVADVMQSATGQPARVTLSEEADTVYKERATVGAVQLTGELAFGGVVAQAGDWVTTRVDGTLGVMKADEFPKVMEPVDGAPGQFRNVHRVIAKLMPHAFTVLCDGVAIQGPPGSYLVQEVPGEEATSVIGAQSIMTPTDFEATYERETPTVGDLVDDQDPPLNDLPLDFDFALYLSTVYAKTVTHIVWLEWPAWASIQVLVVIAWATSVFLASDRLVYPAMVLGYAILAVVICVWRKLLHIQVQLTSAQAVRKQRMLNLEDAAPPADVERPAAPRTPSVAQVQRPKRVPSPVAAVSPAGRRLPRGRSFSADVMSRQAAAARVTPARAARDASRLNPVASSKTRGPMVLAKSNAVAPSEQATPKTFMFRLGGLPADDSERDPGLSSVPEGAGAGSGSDYSINLPPHTHGDEDDDLRRAWGLATASARARGEALPTLAGFSVTEAGAVTVGARTPGNADVDSKADPVPAPAHMRGVHADVATTRADTDRDEDNQVVLFDHENYGTSVRDVVESARYKAPSIFAHTAAKAFARKLRRRIQKQKEVPKAKRLTALQRFRAAAKRVAIVGLFNRLQRALDTAPFEKAPLRTTGSCRLCCRPNGLFVPQNRHQQLFWCGARGVSFMRLVIQILMLSCAVFVSAGFTLLFSSHAPCEIGAHTSSFPVCLGWMGIMSFPAIAFAVLLPRIVETFVVVSNIEHMRKNDAVREVMQSQYTRQAMRALRMLSALALNASAGFHEMYQSSLGGKARIPSPRSIEPLTSLKSPVRDAVQKHRQSFAIRLSSVASMPTSVRSPATVEVYGARNTGQFVRRRAEIRDVFSTFDRDMKGFITLDNMRSLLSQLGARELNERVLRQMMMTLDFNGDGRIMFHEFFEWIARQDESAQGTSPVAVTQYMFALIDTENRGYVTVDSLRQALACLGAFVRFDDLARMVNNFDGTGTGCLNFSDFRRMLNEHNKFNKWFM